MLFAVLWGVLGFTLSLNVIVPNCDPFGQSSIFNICTLGIIFFICICIAIGVFMDIMRTKLEKLENDVNVIRSSHDIDGNHYQTSCVA